MTLVQLRHLIALADSGSFSRSAQRLHITQSAFSRSIKALEDEIGLRLFDRIGQRSELTPAGRELVGRARRLVFDADEMHESGQRMLSGDGGLVRIGMGSGPGAMLMTPLLMRMARDFPGIRVTVSRGATAMLVQALRERTLDALVVDARSLVPAPDLRMQVLCEMRGSFMCRRGHPLLKRRTGTLDAVRQYPVASTPLSDEVARILVERYGPQAHPEHLVTLRCDELPSLLAVAQRSDAVLLAIRAAAPALVELSMKPALNATARFGLVTLAGRTEAPALRVVRDLMDAVLHD
jgi:DNA-binding transcriptional LysR family regulator